MPESKGLPWKITSAEPTPPLHASILPVASILFRGSTGSTESSSEPPSSTYRRSHGAPSPIQRRRERNDRFPRPSSFFISRGARGGLLDQTHRNQLQGRRRPLRWQGPRGAHATMAGWSLLHRVLQRREGGTICENKGSASSPHNRLLRESNSCRQRIR